MKHSLNFLIAFLMLCVSNFIYAQKTANEYDLIYGLNTQLYNGLINNSVEQQNVKGHKFYSSKEFVHGTIKIKGKIYDCSRINYDVYNQKLLLKYVDPNGALKIISISDAWLEEFSLNDIRFIFDRDAKKIYQIIEAGNIRLLYYWSKYLSLKYKSGKSNYYYSKPQKNSYIKINGKLLKYKNNKNFMYAFGKEKQVLIKKYLKENKIKVKKASDNEMFLLISYCNKIK